MPPDALLVAVLECYCSAASWLAATRRPRVARKLVAHAAELVRHHAALPDDALDELAALAGGPPPCS